MCSYFIEWVMNVSYIERECHLWDTPASAESPKEQVFQKTDIFLQSNDKSCMFYEHVKFSHRARSISYIPNLLAIMVMLRHPATPSWGF